MPKNFRTFVLEPSRTPPTAATFGYWDVYIGMMEADDKDPDHWSQVSAPPLLFSKAFDGYTMEPNTDSIENLIKIAKSYPTHPNAPDWFAQIQKAFDDYKTSHGHPAAVAAPPPGATTNSNISVVTEQQGDAVVITTHTNAAAGHPPAPAQ
jgi:hypothetical protein